MTCIYKRANSRFHFSRQLKRAAVSCKDMLRIYIAVIRPVMEYAAPVWHTSLTAELVEGLKSVQKRAFRIIFVGSSITDFSYLSFCESIAISSLQSRRETFIIHIFFIKVWNRRPVFTTAFQSKDLIANLKTLRNCSLYTPPFTV